MSDTTNESVVVRLDAAAHREVQALLPWHAVQALDAADRDRVEAHLAECALCQADLAAERRLLAAHALADAAPDEAALEAALARIHARIDERRRPAGLLGAAWRGLGAAWLALPRAGRIVLGGQFAAIALLALALGLAPRPDARYRTLGAAPTAPTGDVIVMFRADATEAELRAALHAGGARIVDGPTAAGAWVLDVPPGRRAAALAALRSQPSVTLAQPLGPERQ